MGSTGECEVRHINDELAQGKKIGDKLEADGMQARLIGKEDIEIVSPLGKDIGSSGFSGGRKVRDMAAQSLDKKDNNHLNFHMGLSDLINHTS